MEICILVLILQELFEPVFKGASPHHFRTCSVNFTLPCIDLICRDINKPSHFRAYNSSYKDRYTARKKRVTMQIITAKRQKLQQLELSQLFQSSAQSSPLETGAEFSVVFPSTVRLSLTQPWTLQRAPALSWAQTPWQREQLHKCLLN